MSAIFVLRVLAKPMLGRCGGCPPPERLPLIRLSDVEDTHRRRALARLCSSQLFGRKGLFRNGGGKVTVTIRT